MEGMYTMSVTPAPGQSSFYFYAPEVENQSRQHGYMTSHPADIPFNAPMTVFPPQQPIYAAMNAHPQLPAKNAFRSALSMPPIASPQPSHLKPTIIVQNGSPALMPLDTRFVNADFYAFPTTPPLSTSGSTISSPPSSCGMLQTPVNSFFPPVKVEGVKEGCESEVHTEILAQPDWSDSPPMTPGEFIVHHQQNMVEIGVLSFPSSYYYWFFFY
jgi:C2H2 transcription facotor